VQVGGEPGVWLRDVAIAGSIRKKPGLWRAELWGDEYGVWVVGTRLPRI